MAARLIEQGIGMLLQYLRAYRNFVDLIPGTNPGTKLA
jgi:hypothetical protein